MRTFLTAVYLLVLACPVWGGFDDVLGYWQVVEDTNPESIVIVYEHKGAVYARMIAIYGDDGRSIAETLKNPKERAKGIKGSPHIVGLDFVWNLKPDSSGLLTGVVIDPDSGKTFSCDLWFDKKRNKLAMRGRLLFFSQTQYWPSIKEDDLPKELRLEAAKLVPKNVLK